MDLFYCLSQLCLNVFFLFFIINFIINWFNFEIHKLSFWGNSLCLLYPKNFIFLLIIIAYF